MKIVIDHGLTENEVALPDHLLRERTDGKIKVGQWEKEVIIQRTDKEAIVVNENFFPFHLPLELSYQMDEKEDTLRIGPIIAFLVTYKEKTYQEIKKYLPYMSLYHQVGGLVFITTVSQTNMSNKTMSGFFYLPHKHDFSHEVKTFPLPDAIFRRCNFYHRNEFQFFWEEMDGKIFNAPILDKYEQYETLKDGKGFSYFPLTFRLDLLMDTMDDYLQSATSFYIKPTYRFQGKGIIYIKKLQNGYLMKTEKETKVVSKSQLMTILKSLFKRKYIVQQAIEGKTNRNIAFRVIMQKNGHNEWEYSGGYARIGKIGSVITNRHSTKETMTIEKALEQFYQAPHIYEEMLKACFEVCEGFDEKGVHFGDLAFDVMVDYNLKVWVIEVNNRHHNHRSPLLTLKDVETYRKIIQTPLLYCKFLSQFPN